MTGWSMIVGENDKGFRIVHVLPEDDMFDHETSSRCWCCPELDEEHFVVTHHSADRREDFEQGLRKPS